jgi:hypothetical protein
VLDEHLLQHRTVEAVLVLAGVGDGMLRLEVEQGGHVASAGIQIEQPATAQFAREDGGEVDGDGRSTTPATGREDREHLPLGVAFAVPELETRESARDFGSEF